ncbi:CoA-transferase family III [Tilletiopsis washingtonensis]|uniref:CoA-transferase family III n=1 Tax=Tilletiopsis washingtonensis TaxID=58919 RepID=A0A316Z8Q4_9BASI|nr:CoA-transferase family III [Tilletiopsis washingtonensis]PWN97322.1 CoA-transferase family III [Tilletiopsis washingtonensis]
MLRTALQRLHAPSPSALRRLATAAAPGQQQQERPPAQGPLTGVRVLELGQLIAGPFCGQILGHFGADVVKIEPPSGDPLRIWRELDEDGTSPWYRSIARNKRSVTVDLRKPEGREVVRRLAREVDVVIENFRPGTMEKWGLGPDELKEDNPGLIMARISGYGQTGPLSDRGGFAAVCEGFGGFRYVNGFPNDEGKLAGAPVRPNLSIGDSLAGVNAALGVVLALFARGKGAAGERQGQTVDVALYESVLCSMMEGCIPAYDRCGVVRGPSGAGVTGIVPTSAFEAKDGYVIVGANGEGLYTRLMQKIGREDLLGPKYNSNAKRVARQKEIEAAITAWTLKHSVQDVILAMEEVRVPCGPVNSVKDIVEHPHVQARGMVEDVTVRSQGREWTVKMTNMSPILERGGATRWAGEDLGASTSEVLQGAGYSEAEIDKLRTDGII